VAKRITQEIGIKAFGLNDAEALAAAFEKLGRVANISGSQVDNFASMLDFFGNKATGAYEAAGRITQVISTLQSKMDAFSEATGAPRSRVSAPKVQAEGFRVGITQSELAVHQARQSGLIQKIEGSHVYDPASLPTEAQLRHGVPAYGRVIRPEAGAKTFQIQRYDESGNTIETISRPIKELTQATKNLEKAITNAAKTDPKAGERYSESYKTKSLRGQFKNADLRSFEEALFEKIPMPLTPMELSNRARQGVMAQAGAPQGAKIRSQELVSYVSKQVGRPASEADIQEWELKTSIINENRLAKRPLDPDVGNLQGMLQVLPPTPGAEAAHERNVAKIKSAQELAQLPTFNKLLRMASDSKGADYLLKGVGNVTSADPLKQAPGVERMLHLESNSRLFAMLESAELSPIQRATAELATQRFKEGAVPEAAAIMREGSVRQGEHARSEGFKAKTASISQRITQMQNKVLASLRDGEITSEDRDTIFNFLKDARKASQDGDHATADRLLSQAGAVHASKAQGERFEKIFTSASRRDEKFEADVSGVEQGARSLMRLGYLTPERYQDFTSAAEEAARDYYGKGKSKSVSKRKLETAKAGLAEVRRSVLSSAKDEAVDNQKSQLRRSIEDLLAEAYHYEQRGEIDFEELDAVRGIASEALAALTEGALPRAQMLFSNARKELHRILKTRGYDDKALARSAQVTALGTRKERAQTQVELLHARGLIEDDVKRQLLTDIHVAYPQELRWSGERAIRVAEERKARGEDPGPGGNYSRHDDGYDPLGTSPRNIKRASEGLKRVEGIISGYQESQKLKSGKASIERAFSSLEARIDKVRDDLDFQEELGNISDEDAQQVRVLISDASRLLFGMKDVDQATNLISAAEGIVQRARSSGSRASRRNLSISSIESRQARAVSSVELLKSSGVINTQTAEGLTTRIKAAHSAEGGPTGGILRAKEELSSIENTIQGLQLGSKVKSSQASNRRKRTDIRNRITKAGREAATKLDLGTVSVEDFSDISNLLEEANVALDDGDPDRALELLSRAEHFLERSRSEESRVSKVQSATRKDISLGREVSSLQTKLSGLVAGGKISPQMASEASQALGETTAFIQSKRRDQAQTSLQKATDIISDAVSQARASEKAITSDTSATRLRTSISQRRLEVRSLLEKRIIDNADAAQAHALLDRAERALDDGDASKASNILAKADSLIASFKAGPTLANISRQRDAAASDIISKAKLAKKDVSIAERLKKLPSADAAALRSKFDTASALARSGGLELAQVAMREASSELKEVFKDIKGVEAVKQGDLSLSQILRSADGLRAQIETQLALGNLSAAVADPIKDLITQAEQAAAGGDHRTANNFIVQAKTALSQALAGYKRNKLTSQQRRSRRKLAGSVNLAQAELSRLISTKGIAAAAPQAALTAAQSALASGDYTSAQENLDRYKLDVAIQKQGVSTASSLESAKRGQVSVTSGIEGARHRLSEMLAAGVITQAEHDRVAQSLQLSENLLATDPDRARTEYAKAGADLKGLTRGVTAASRVERRRQGEFSQERQLIRARLQIDRLDPNLTGATGATAADLGSLRADLSSAAAMAPGQARATAISALLANLTSVQGGVSSDKSSFAASSKNSSQVSQLRRLENKIAKLLSSGDMLPGTAQTLRAKIVQAAASQNADEITSIIKDVEADITVAESARQIREGASGKTSKLATARSRVRDARGLIGALSIIDTPYMATQRAELGTAARLLEGTAFDASDTGRRLRERRGLGAVPMSAVEAAQQALVDKERTVKQGATETTKLTDKLDKLADSIEKLFGPGDVAATSPIGGRITGIRGKIGAGKFDDARRDLASLQETTEQADELLDEREGAAKTEMASLRRERKKTALMMRLGDLKDKKNLKELERHGLTEADINEYAYKQGLADQSEQDAPGSRVSKITQDEADVAFEKIQNAEDKRKRELADIHRGAAYRLGVVKNFTRTASAISGAIGQVAASDVRGASALPTAFGSAIGGALRDYGGNRLINEGFRKPGGGLNLGPMAFTAAGAILAGTSDVFSNVLQRGIGVIDRANQSSVLVTQGFEELRAREGLAGVGGVEPGGITLRDPKTGALYSKDQLIAFSTAYENEDDYEDAKEAFTADPDTLAEAVKAFGQGGVTKLSMRELERRSFEELAGNLYGSQSFGMGREQLGRILTSSSRGLGGAFAESRETLFAEMTDEMRENLIAEILQKHRSRGLEDPQGNVKNSPFFNSTVDAYVPRSLQAAGGIARLSNYFGFDDATLASIDSMQNAFGMRSGDLKVLPGLFSASGLGFGRGAQNAFMSQAASQLEAAGMMGITPNIADSASFFFGAAKRGGNAARMAAGFNRSMTDMGGVMQQITGGTRGLGEQLLMAKALGEFGSLPEALSAIQEQRPGYTVTDREKGLLDAVGEEIYAVNKMDSGFTAGDVSSMLATLKEGGTLPPDLFSEEFARTAGEESQMKKRAEALTSEVDVQAQMTSLRTMVYEGLKTQFDEISASFAGSVSDFGSAVTKLWGMVSDIKGEAPTPTGITL
jgi:hypothetical protein